MAAIRHWIASPLFMKDWLLRNIEFNSLVTSKTIVSLVIYLLAGAAGALVIRFIYLRFARSVSNRDDFSAVFVPLTVSTVLIISIVKSSLALSLGLVGALSIVRFRAAIKDPEELVYLFFCIALGLALGAGNLIEAFVGLIVFAILMILLSRFMGGSSSANALITFSAPSPTFYPAEDGSDLRTAVRKVIPKFVIERFETDSEESQLRMRVEAESDDQVIDALETLRKQLPGVHISYVNLQEL